MDYEMKLILTLGFLVPFLYAQSQNLTHSLHIGNKYTNEQLTNAVNNANWCGYIHEFENYKIVFDDGAEVLLKSQKQALNDGINLKGNCIQSVKVASKHVYSIAKNGIIVIRAERDLKKANSFKQ